MALIVAEHGPTEIAAELMAKLYAASENPAFCPSPDQFALQLCFSGRAMIKTQVVKLTTSRGDYSRSELMSNALRNAWSCSVCIAETSCSPVAAGWY